MISLLPSANSGHSALSCPAASVRPSVHPAFVTIPQPTIFCGSCFTFGSAIDFSMSMNSVEYWVYMFIFMIQWHFEIFRIHWLTWSIPTEGSCLLDGTLYFIALTGLLLKIYHVFFITLLIPKQKKLRSLLSLLDYIIIKQAGLLKCGSPSGFMLLQLLLMTLFICWNWPLPMQSPCIQ